MTERNITPLNITGQRYGRWVVLREGKRVKKTRYWFCRCDCGTVKEVEQNSLRRGTSPSCGCQRNETRTKHGASTTVEYPIWAAMLQRCLNPKCAAFKDYGGRGITVCERWLKFENFIADMGKRPSHHFWLERTKNNEGYNPDNCKWATTLEQGDNKRSTRTLTFNGQTLSLQGWSKKLQLPPYVIDSRLNRLGWSVEKTLSTPAKKMK